MSRPGAGAGRRPGRPGPAPSVAPRATAVLLLGVGSLVLVTLGFGFLLALVALVLAPGARREIAASGGRLVGDTQVRVGRITSWVTLAVTGLGLLLLLVTYALDTASASGGF